jgi:hypothetical protein
MTPKKKMRSYMEKVGLNITQKEFKQLSKWAENIYKRYHIELDEIVPMGDVNAFEE